MEFKDKRIIITGGTRGIGRATALAFAEKGANVAVTYASDSRSAEQMEKALADSGQDAMVVQSDITGKDEAAHLVSMVVQRWGGVDIMVNNAGIHRDKLLMFLTEKDWDDVIGVNLRATFLLCQAVLKPMISQRWGRIINIVSPSGIKGRAGQANYSASKGGIISLTKSLAKEVAKIGITVNCVSPGVIQTSMTGKLDAHVLDDLKKQIPAARFGKSGEVAHAIVFCASPQASYITGQIIAVDGGLT
ncbi:MAG: 3-oxoacyl-[acyl-carrier-protein] reductase [Desulfobacteraceae bacterium]|nr:3-oxoacyl-[acyl-carrier-protein] reductase [Desulfobacteraceae bacterium]